MELDIFYSFDVIGFFDTTWSFFDSKFEYFTVLNKKIELVFVIGTRDYLKDPFCFERRVDIFNINFIEVFCIQLVISYPETHIWAQSNLKRLDRVESSYLGLTITFIIENNFEWNYWLRH